MGTLIHKGVIYITVSEIINYLNGMKEDLENQREINERQIEERVEDEEFGRLIKKIDRDNFTFFTGKLDATMDDLKHHLDRATTQMSMQKKRSKKNCEKCDKVYASRSSLFPLIDDMGMYHFYCKGCIKEEIFKSELLVEEEKEKIMKMENKDLKMAMDIINMNITNKIFADPERQKKIKESEPYKEMMKALLGEEKEE